MKRYKYQNTQKWFASAGDTILGQHVFAKRDYMISMPQSERINSINRTDSDGPIIPVHRPGSTREKSLWRSFKKDPNITDLVVVKLVSAGGVHKVVWFTFTSKRAEKNRRFAYLRATCRCSSEGMNLEFVLETLVVEKASIEATQLKESMDKQYANLGARSVHHRRAGPGAQIEAAPAEEVAVAAHKTQRIQH